jgi:DNA topoisomerase-2
MAVSSTSNSISRTGSTLDVAGIVSGLSSEDRNTIGVYPMKGKILNVRGEQVKRIAENKEIAEIKKILGLETGKEYKSEADVAK